MSQTTACHEPRFTDVFVERPVVAIVLSLALLLLGARAAVELPILQFPQLESASLQINTAYVGASAEVVQGFVTEPIERIAATMPGVDYIDSVTNPGFSLVRVWLDLNEDSTDALAELTARLNQITFELPVGAEDPAVTVFRADRPFAAFYLDVIVKPPFKRETVSDYLAREINPVLSAIPGVQRVGLEGGRQPAMRVWLDPERLARYDLSTADVRRMLERNNVITTLGRSESAVQRVNLLSNATLRNVSDFETLVIAERDGELVRLADVARIERGAEEGTTIARLTHNNAVFISIWPLPGANEIEIGDELYKALDELAPRLPNGLEIGIGYDATLYMRDAIREIFITLLETVLLVGAVVVLFMGSLRTALVPLVAIPISLLGALAAMSMLGFSLNLLTILAIVLSVGLVVDDAIVVVENVARYVAEGHSRTEAALASSRQLLSPIFGMTMTLAAVYAPIGFISGLSGVLFREFAFALATAVLFSGLVAIMLSPVMSSWLAPSKRKPSKFSTTVTQAFANLQTRYERVLTSTLRARGPIIFVAIFISFLSVPLYLFSLKELAPTEDQSSVDVVFESAADASLGYTEQYVDSAVAVMQSLEGATAMWQIVFPEGGFGGQQLVAPEDREQSSADLLQTAFMGLAGVSGVKAFPVLPAPLPTAGNFDVELVIRSGESPEEMLRWAQALSGWANESGAFLYASSDLKIDLQQARLVFDRARIADLGLSVADVSDQLSVMLAGNYINRFEDSGKAFRVIPMLQTVDRADPSSLLDLEIRSASGDRIPLRAVAAIERQVAPRSLTRFQQSNAFRVFGAAMPGTTKAQALNALEAQAKLMLPPGYSIDYAGESRQLRKDGSTMVGVLALSLIIVYLVLAIQFNSFRDPLVVLLGSVPLALAGAMTISFVDLTTINIYSQVGLITLVGLVAKNAILVVEFARQLRADGMRKTQAIVHSAVTRLRPVLMTTGATVLGHFPLVLVSGAGAEARNSIGFILVFGMLIGTLFTLFVLPQVYLLIAKPDSSEDRLDEQAGDSLLQPA